MFWLMIPRVLKWVFYWKRILLYLGLIVVFLVGRAVLNNMRWGQHYVYPDIPMVEANSGMLPSERFFALLPQSEPLGMGKVAIHVNDICLACNPGMQGIISTALSPFGNYFGTVKWPNEGTNEEAYYLDLVKNRNVEWKVPSSQEFGGQTGQGLEFLDKMDGKVDGLFQPYLAFVLTARCLGASGETSGSSAGMPVYPWVTLVAPLDYEFNYVKDRLVGKDGQITEVIERAPAGPVVLLSLPLLLEDSAINLCPNLGFTPGINLQQLTDFFYWDISKVSLPHFWQANPDSTGTDFYTAKRMGRLQWYPPVKDLGYKQVLNSLTPVKYLVQSAQVRTLSAFWKATETDPEKLRGIKNATCPFTWVINPLDLEEGWESVHLLTHSEIAGWYNPQSPTYDGEFVRLVKDWAENHGISLEELEVTPLRLEEAQLAAAFEYKASHLPNFAPIDVVRMGWFVWAGSKQEGCVSTAPEVLGTPKGNAVLAPVVYAHSGVRTYVSLIRLQINQPIKLVDPSTGELKVMGVKTWFGLGPAADFNEEGELTMSGQVGGLVETPELPTSMIPGASGEAGTVFEGAEASPTAIPTPSIPEGLKGALIPNPGENMITFYDPNDQKVQLPAFIWQNVLVVYEVLDDTKAKILWTEMVSPTQFAGFKVKLENISTE